MNDQPSTDADESADDVSPELVSALSGGGSPSIPPLPGPVSEFVCNVPTLVIDGSRKAEVEQAALQWAKPEGFFPGRRGGMAVLVKNSAWEGKSELHLWITESDGKTRVEVGGSAGGRPGTWHIDDSRLPDHPGMSRLVTKVRDRRGRLFAHIQARFPGATTCNSQRYVPARPKRARTGARIAGLVVGIISFIVFWFIGKGCADSLFR